MLLVLAAVAASTLAARAEEPDGKPVADEGRFQVLQREIETAKLAYRRALSEAGTDEEREALSREHAEWTSRLAARALESARGGSREPAAVDVLTWITREASQPLVEEARTVLMNRYIENEKLIDACRYAADAVGIDSHSAEGLLREAMVKSPHRRVRGMARFYLAELLEGRISTLHDHERHPDQVEGYFGGREGWKQFSRRSPEDLAKEVGELYEQIIGGYADLSSRGSMLGEVAKGRLFRIRNLSIGKLAPEIEGEDVDGKRFKLSDYRGKVVLLTFSGNWCGSCRAFYPKERELLSRLKDRPFEILSVNTDEDKETLQRSVQTGEVAWRCWRDGGTSGPITLAWGVYYFPTVFVLDHRGVIRYEQIGDQELDKALGGLLAEAEKGK
jgi:peroxiredoxin